MEPRLFSTNSPKGYFSLHINNMNTSSVSRIHYFLFLYFHSFRVITLTYFLLLVSFYKPKNITKPVLSRVIEKDHGGVNGTMTLVCIPQFCSKSTTYYVDSDNVMNKVICFTIGRFVVLASKADMHQDGR